MIKGYLNLIVFIAVIGSFLFGVSMGAVAGAGSFLEQAFGMDSLGFTVSILVIGCMIGAFLWGPISDRIGRKRALLSISILFSIGFLGQFIGVDNLILLRISRLIGGMAVGAVSVVVPAYISEVSPTDIRGKMGSMAQFGIVIGIMVAYCIDYVVVDFNQAQAYMLGQGLPFALLYFLGILFLLPESPDWLLERGRVKEAFAIYRKIGGVAYAHQQVEQTSSSKGQNENNGASLTVFKGKMGKVLIFGILLAVFQQVTGINAIIFYAPKIIEQVGAGADPLISAIMIGVVNFLFTIIAIPLVDRVGRKKLLLLGAVGMVISLSYIAFNFGNELAGAGILFALMSYIAFFAFTWGPVMWIVNSEIFPGRIRGLAMSIAIAMSWVCTFLLGQYFPFMLEILQGKVFSGFAVMSLVAFAFTYIFIPETKGKSFAEIQKDLGLEESMEKNAIIESGSDYSGKASLT
ncbi:sugar porter family MFS transporter [Aureibacter tunicatorum]|uniref:Sugar porter (SP) family MFS transporter n=1 Tax=Aureibacter tunicatorum TaxID=866807 RepID=A0AAE3XQX2_9BACT|nr:sugar porter family MFS transporter [Aureibacter tunicatorum]MDR6240300.1 sugar porter (SP) family MFS transporter [Aureibacter tunicatorum]BDD05819.1 MFS transporter [Aureibacter tunicatorum]